MIWNPFRKRLNAEARKKLVERLLQTLMSDEAIMQPLFCPFIRRESDGEQNSYRLPLIYIWENADLKDSLSVSINGPIVGETLEHFLPRSSPDFLAVRDEAFDALLNTVPKSIMQTCDQLGLHPKELYSFEIWQEANRRRKQRLAKRSK